MHRNFGGGNFHKSKTLLSGDRGRHLVTVMTFEDDEIESAADAPGTPTWNAASRRSSVALASVLGILFLLLVMILASGMAYSREELSAMRLITFGSTVACCVFAFAASYAASKGHQPAFRRYFLLFFVFLLILAVPIFMSRLAQASAN